MEEGCLAAKARSFGGQSAEEEGEGRMSKRRRFNGARRCGTSELWSLGAVATQA